MSKNLDPFIKQMNEVFEKLPSTIEELNADNKKLIKCIEFYANEDTYAAGREISENKNYFLGTMAKNTLREIIWGSND